MLSKAGFLFIYFKNFPVKVVNFLTKKKKNPHRLAYGRRIPVFNLMVPSLSSGFIFNLILYNFNTM